ncbi:SIMPL domain-containing protein [Arcicella sp. LKC2W]|uniref:SIMPL domain-containing protein n=1 Tax=Arcicella sp. LKC2W TaxID=2984198 RepID=UPI002B2043D0|nr:SIMPL domain-containing protein [Arcicella sp. LKC2W]MEA5459685.1 SIMPL domain-containing protein [Arcicella sp. LKC2W]
MNRLIKTLTMSTLMLATAFVGNAQTMEKPLVKKIEVNGSAEQEVLPDEIYVSISLREYFKDKDNKNKIDIMVLEKQLQKAVEEAGIPKENFSIGAINGYREWWGKKKPTTFLETKNYILKVSNLYKIDGIVSKVEEKGVAGINIDRYEFSKIEQLRRDIKIKALQAAKEKAKYLLEGIGEQLGEAIEITEIDNGYTPQPVYSNMMMRSAKMEMAADAMPESTIDVQKIKVRYEMKAVFKIK